MASTATFKFGLQISKSHGPTKGGGMQVKIAQVKSARRKSSYAWLYDMK